MNTEHDLKVGQQLYLMPFGNASRYYKGVVLDEIVSVGRVYYKTKSGREFDKKTLKYKDRGSNSDYVIFTSQLEYDNEVQRSNMWDLLRREIARPFRCPYTLEQLHQVFNALNSKPK